MSVYLIILISCILIFGGCMWWLWRDPLRFCLLTFTDLVAFRVLTGNINVVAHASGIDIPFLDGTIDIELGQDGWTYLISLVAALLGWGFSAWLYYRFQAIVHQPPACAAEPVAAEAAPYEQRRWSEAGRRQTRS